MPLWSENFSTRSLEEVLALETENRAWNKALRVQASALVNRRLAQQITLEEYAACRLQASDDAAECRRRSVILVNEIRSRALHPAQVA